MWRTQAIIDLLFEDIAGLADGDRAAAARARRKAGWVVAVEWLAILLLVAFHDRASPQLTLSSTAQSVFTVGILVVAAHSGFRLGQLWTLRAVERLATELEERRGE